MGPSQSSGEFLRVAIDEQQHVALPKLYGAPAYSRPTMSVAHSPRPFDPDDLPLTVEQTDDERRLLEALPARAYAPGGGVYLEPAEGSNGNGHRPMLVGRPFRLKALAGRLLGRDA